MLQIERREQILQLLSHTAALRVTELAKTLYTSEATVRRDITAMERAGLVHRVYGGVVKKREDMPLDFRYQENAEAKRVMAQKAVALIGEGDTVFLDASSSVQHMLPLIARMPPLTLITNSHRVLEALSATEHALICTGGNLSKRNMVYVGRVAEAAFSQLCPSIAFFSSQGITASGEVTDASEEETALRRAVLKSASRAVLLCGSEKLGKRFLHRLCHVSSLHAVITEREESIEELLQNTP